MELKPATPSEMLTSSRPCSNRTFMELKLQVVTCYEFVGQRSNRTFMELKRDAGILPLRMHQF